MMHFFFKSFIKTELVTVEKADIISSFEQVYQIPNLKAKWVTYDTDYENFESAPSDSVQHRLWLRSQPNPLFTLTMDNVETSQAYLEAICAADMVVIGHWVTMDLMYACICPVSRYLKFKKPMIKRLAQNSEVPKASVYNDRLDERIIKALARRTMALAESDLQKYFLSNAESPYDISFVPKEHFQSCREDHAGEAGHPVVPQKVMKDFESLFKLSCCINAFSLCVIVCEYFYNIYHAYKRQKARKQKI